MKIMILGHAEHGKTTLANLLKDRFGFAFTDTTVKLNRIVVKYLIQNQEKMNSVVEKLDTCFDVEPKVYNKSWQILQLIHDHKDVMRPLMKEALIDYTKTDRAKFIKEVYEVSDVYAGCRAQQELDAAAPLIDLILWIEDPRKEANDSSMDIVYNPKTMVSLDNSSTLAYLEAQVKKALATKARIPIRSFDKTWRDALISGLVQSH